MSARRGSLMNSPVRSNPLDAGARRETKNQHPGSREQFLDQRPKRLPLRAAAAEGMPSPWLLQRFTRGCVGGEKAAARANGSDGDGIGLQRGAAAIGLLVTLLLEYRLHGVAGGRGHGEAAGPVVAHPDIEPLDFQVELAVAAGSRLGLGQGHPLLFGLRL